MLGSKNLLTFVVVVGKERHAVVSFEIACGWVDIAEAASHAPRAESLAEQGLGHQEALLGDPAHGDAEKKKEENLSHLDLLKF